jgi:hypothetical protein
MVNTVTYYYLELVVCGVGVSGAHRVTVSGVSGGC